MSGPVVCGTDLGPPGLDGLGLGEYGARRGTQHAAEVPDAAVLGLMAWAVAGERHTGIRLAGTALAPAGVALAQFAGKRTDAEREGVAPVD